MVKVPFDLSPATLHRACAASLSYRRFNLHKILIKNIHSLLHRWLNRVALQEMDHELSLPVDYKGKELEFPFSVVPQGYTYKFVVQVEDAEVVFERDEGGEFRALIQNPETFTGKLPEAELLQAIAETIQELQS